MKLTDIGRMVNYSSNIGCPDKLPMVDKEACHWTFLRFDTTQLSYWVNCQSYTELCFIESETAIFRPS